MPNTQLRLATRDDSDALTALYLRTRRDALPWLVPVHADAATRAWMEHVIVAEHHVVVVQAADDLAGFAAVYEDWLQQLWVDPAHQRQGHGTRLLDAAKEHNPNGLQLHVFTRNTAARAFYERSGFVQSGSRDGSGNEEGEPDLTYRWSPTSAP